MATTELDLGRYKLGWSDPEEYVFKPRKGLNEDIVKEMSWMKGEPDWMTRFRLRSLSLFERKPMLEWFARNMPSIDFDDVYYYIKPTDKQVSDWEMLPESVKATYDKLGIPEAERKFLAGVTAQYESEVVYHKNRQELEDQGVLFADMDTAVREWPDLVKPYFGSIIPPTTTSSPPSTRRCGAAGRSSTSRPTPTSRCRCRPTSGSTPRTWASSSGR